MSAGGLQAMRAFLALAALLAGPTSAATGAAHAGSAVVAVDAEGGIGRGRRQQHTDTGPCVTRRRAG